MPKATLRDIAIQGKRLFVRVDFNVPLSKEERSRTIRASVPCCRRLPMRSRKAPG